MISISLFKKVAQIVATSILLFSIVLGCTPNTDSIAPTENVSVGARSEYTIITPTAIHTIEPTLEPTLVPIPAPTLAPMEDFIQGVWYGGYFQKQFSNPYSDWTLENIVKPTGANWIDIHFFCYVDNYRATEVLCGTNNTTTKSDIRHAVNIAHELGLRVFMEAGLVFLNDPNHWSGDIGRGFGEELWEAWFDGYETYITEYAVLANELNVDMFSIGQELNGTQHRDENWREIAAAVREEYDGPIVYSPDATGGENWLEITWWDAVDSIGIHPYDIRLSDHANPTVEEMVEYLTPVVDRLETLSQEFDRPVIITELAYSSIDGMSAGSWVYYGTNTNYEVDLQEHADIYEALIKAFSGRASWKGLFLGDYFPTNNNLITPPNNIFFSTYGKPAENVLRSFYGAEPQPVWIAPESPDAREMDIHVIYDDYFRNDWGYWPPDNNFDLMDICQTDTVIAGNAISVVLDRYQDLRISPPETADVSEYQWITFDLYTESNKVWDQTQGNYHPVNLLMVLFGGYYQATPFSAEITATPYLDEPLMAGHWHHVLIPINDFGPMLSLSVNDISIRNISPNTVKIYLDDIQLLKEKPTE